MLAEALPCCPFCGGRDFQTNGGNFGSALSQQAPRIPGVHILLQQQNVEKGPGTTMPLGSSTGHANGDRNWAPIDYTYSATLPVPEDPILRRNREFFNEVWAEVAVNIEQEFPERAEAKNEYGGIEPWYTFTLNGCTFLVGWRKRVVSIHVDAPNGIDTEDIRTRATRDNVTYQAYGPARLMTPDEYEAIIRAQIKDENSAADVDRIVTTFRELHPNGEEGMREGGWNNDMPVASLLTVHAWGKDKTVEYLTSLCRTVLTKAAACES